LDDIVKDVIGAQILLCKRAENGAPGAIKMKQLTDTFWLLPGVLLCPQILKRTIEPFRAVIHTGPAPRWSQKGRATFQAAEELVVAGQVAGPILQKVFCLI